MLHTSEIRWFIAGILSDQTLSWFIAGHLLERATVQVHEYLLLPGCDTVSVKFREDRFEIKVNLGASQAIRLPAGIQGRSERWVKWSLPTKGLPMLGRTLHQSGPWLKVRKERNQRILSAETGHLEEVSRNSLPVTGCNIELTSIEVEADPPSWFTLGFEAYGPPSDTDAILKEGISSFFKAHRQPPGTNLTKTSSFSYPKWFLNLGMR